jgi:hypothetical protein
VNAVRAIILFFAVTEAGWMAFDGARALNVGSLITPRSGPYAGQVGPWRLLVAPLGIAPNGKAMHWLFAVYGCAWLAVAFAFALREPWAWHAMIAAAVCSLWFLPFGTAASLVQVVLLISWRAHLP